MSEKSMLSLDSLLLKSHLLSLIGAVALFAFGLANASATLLIASGIVAYGWPFFYVYRLKAQEKVEEAPKAVKQLQSAHPSAVGAR